MNKQQDGAALHKEKRISAIPAHMTADLTTRNHEDVVDGNNERILVKYKCQKNGVPIGSTNGSAVPLVNNGSSYDPFFDRNVSHATTDWDTLVHLLKGSLGTGILAMPFAFMHSGLYFGLFATAIIGFVCTYCIHILVKCSHVLCRRMQVASLSYADIAESAFHSGGPWLQKYAKVARGTVDLFLCIDLLGCCCVYVVFVSKNLKQVIDYYTCVDLAVQYYMLALLPFLISLNLIRNLKYLAPFSMVANMLTVVAMVITFYFIFESPGEWHDQSPAVADWRQLPLFFGTAIFALEGIGVVMPLENNMKTPQHFLGCPGVLNIGMFLVVLLYTTFGFFGYLKFGPNTQASITLNLDPNHYLAQLVQVTIAIAIFITFSLQFYVPMEIIWKVMQEKLGYSRISVEYALRIVLVIIIVVVAAIVPQLGPFISLIGAVCLSTLGLILPSVIELVTRQETPGYGKFNWVIWKNVFIISFGILGFVTGAYSSIIDIIRDFSATHVAISIPSICNYNASSHQST